MKKKTVKGIEYTAMRYVSRRTVETERGKEYYYSYTPCKKREKPNAWITGDFQMGQTYEPNFYNFL